MVLSTAMQSPQRKRGRGALPSNPCRLWLPLLLMDALGEKSQVWAASPFSTPFHPRDLRLGGGYGPVESERWTQKQRGTRELGAPSFPADGKPTIAGRAWKPGASAGTSQSGRTLWERQWAEGAGKQEVPALPGEEERGLCGRS